MIGWIEGRVVHETGDHLVVASGGLGYEIFVPPYQLAALRAKRLPPDDPRARLTDLAEAVSLYIYYHVAERKPLPALFGFNEPLERDFFALLSSVSRFGPTAAARSMTISVPEYAGLIMTRDIRALRTLPGIGTGKAEQMIAQLRGKMALFAMMPEEELPERPVGAADQFLLQAQVALEELGFRPAEAEAMVRTTYESHPELTTLEALLDALWNDRRRP